MPDANPTGDYRRTFAADFTRAVLRFEGVDSSCKVWLNGELLGTSRGSRLPAEFDVTLRAGTNVLAVRVHQWSSGSYLEDQDMWWLSGIFREVTVFPTPTIEDVFVHADYEDGTGTLRVEAPGRVDRPRARHRRRRRGDRVSARRALERRGPAALRRRSSTTTASASR